MASISMSRLPAAAGRWRHEPPEAEADRDALRSIADIDGIGGIGAGLAGAVDQGGGAFLRCSWGKHGGGLAAHALPINLAFCRRSVSR